jgi:UDP-glucose 4-epimerase
VKAGGIVVTGASGIVGRTVLAALRRRGEDVVPVVHGRTTDPDAIGLDLAKADSDLTDHVSAPEAVVHLAAAVPHAAHHGDTEAAADTTRRIDETVHRACGRWGCPTIYASTCGLYDRRDPRIKDEAAPVVATSPYFRAKLDGERLMSDLPGACVMRISAPVGPGLRRGVVLAKFIERARAGEPIEIWGSGCREQDFIAAEDVAAFVTVALSSHAQGVFNIASGSPVTMRALAEAVVDAIGRGSVQSSDAEDPLDGETARYSIDRAAQALGWHPRIPLRAAIETIADGAFPA